MLTHTHTRPFFKAQTNQGTLELLVYAEIGATWDGSGVTASDVKEQIDAAGPVNKVVMRINSPGGDVFEGVAIYNLLRAAKKPIEVCVDGIAASSASIVAMAGDQITMGTNAMLMIHDAWSLCIGNASEMRKMADTLEKVSESIAQTYVDRTGNSMSDVKAMMDAETWLTAKDCIEKGFATGIAEAPDEQSSNAVAMARNFKKLSQYARTPEQFKAENPADPEEQETEQDPAPECPCGCEACIAKNCNNCDVTNCVHDVCQTNGCQQTQSRASNLSQYEARLALLKLHHN